jgi:hypothetical protein
MREGLVQEANDPRGVLGQVPPSRPDAVSPRSVRQSVIDATLPEPIRLQYDADMVPLSATPAIEPYLHLES